MTSPRRHPPPAATAARRAFTGIAIFCLGCAFACGPRAACPQPGAANDSSATACATACPGWSTKRGGTCECRADATPWLGACVASSLALRACGAAETLTAGVCVAKTCGADQVFDEAVGGCVAWSTVKPGEGTSGLPPAPDERIQCPTDATLLVSRGRARCLPHYACARGLFSTEEPVLDAGAPLEGGAPAVRDSGAPRDGGAARDGGGAQDGGAPGVCERAAPCAAGSLPEPRGSHACVSFMSATGFVDPARWLRLTAGDEGGPGSRWVCEPLDVLGAKVFDPRGVGRRISLQLDIPSNDVSQASLTARSDEAAEGTQRLEKGLETYAEAFRSLGGTATTTQAAVHVICRVPASPRPVKLHVDVAP